MLTLEQISALVRSRRPGHSLPQPLYNDPDAFAFDMEAIYGRSWIMVGFEVELPKPGSYMALTIGTWPVLIVRDRAGELHAFHNTCRHRGSQICADGHGTSARLVCPYHRWTYELTGELVHAARMGADFDVSEHGLAPIHVESVGGVLYVCLAETPPPIADFRETFEPLMAPHNLQGQQGRLREHPGREGQLEAGHGERARVLSLRRPAIRSWRRAFPSRPAPTSTSAKTASANAYNARMEKLGLPVGPIEGEWWQAIRFPLNDGCRSMTMDGRPAVDKLMCEAGDGDIGSLRWSVEPHGFGHATADHLFMFSALPRRARGDADRLQVAGAQGRGRGRRLRRRAPDRALDETNLQDRDLVENNQRGVELAGLSARPLFPGGRRPRDPLRRLVLRPRPRLSGDVSARQPPRRAPANPRPIPRLLDV